MMEHESTQGGALKAYGLKLVDTVYKASAYTVIAYSALLLMLATIALALHFGLIDVPEFHPK